MNPKSECINIFRGLALSLTAFSGKHIEQYITPLSQIIQKMEYIEAMSIALDIQSGNL